MQNDFKIIYIDGAWHLREVEMCSSWFNVVHDFCNATGEMHDRIISIERLPING